MTFLRPDWLNIALTVVYNQGRTGNETLAQRILAATEERHLPILDDRGRPVLDDAGTPVFVAYRAFPSLPQDHEVGFVKILPPGVARPPSDGLLQRQIRAIEYGTQAEYDRQARNFGLSRSFGYFSAAALLDVTDAAQLAAPDLGRTERYSEEPWGRLIKREAYERAGLLREDIPEADARDEWKDRATRVAARRG